MENVIISWTEKYLIANDGRCTIVLYESRIGVHGHALALATCDWANIILRKPAKQMGGMATVTAGLAPGEPRLEW